VTSDIPDIDVSSFDGLRRGARKRFRSPVPQAHQSDRAYTDEETEMLLAVAAFKNLTGKRFPQLTEIFHVFRSLGYRKV
jgi:hypothetical protein